MNNKSAMSFAFVITFDCGCTLLVHRTNVTRQPWCDQAHGQLGMRLILPLTNLWEANCLSLDVNNWSVMVSVRASWSWDKFTQASLKPSSIDRDSNTWHFPCSSYYTQNFAHYSFENFPKISPIILILIL